MAKCGENIYKRKDGRWEGRFIRSRRENGHAIYGYVYGRSYTECKGKLKEAAIAPPRMMCGCRLTAKELFSSLLRKKCAEVKPSTAQRYRFLIEKHILPELGHLRVEQLTAKKLQAFLQRKRVNGGLKGGGLSVKTVRDIGTLIKSALKYAQAEFSVPCDADALRLPSPAQPDIRVFTEDELRRMAEQVMRKPQPIEIGILLALNTGLRIGELCALQRQDIDFTAGTVSVRNTAQRINYGGRTKLVVQTPKSAASNRVIPIPADTAAAVCICLCAGLLFIKRKPSTAIGAAHLPEAFQGTAETLRTSRSKLPQYAPHLRHALRGGGCGHQNCLGITWTFQSADHAAALYALVHAAQTGGRPADQLSALWCMKLYRRQFCRQTPGQILAPQAVSLLLS